MNDKANAIERVKSYADLQHNWDGYGAKPIARDTIDHALALIETLGDLPCKHFNPAPGGDGSIGFEIVWEDGRELWFDVGPREMTAYIPRRAR